MLFSCISVLLIFLFARIEPAVRHQQQPAKQTAQTETADQLNKQTSSGLKASKANSEGKLFIHGGGAKGVTEFVKLIKDKTKPIVVIPTADVGENFGKSWPGLWPFYAAGFKDITVLHTRDPNIANQDEFVEPLRKAVGVWISGGRQWKLADAYLNTKVHKELTALLDRGGIIGGSSAGATILGSFLVRGDTRTNTIMIGDHIEGFGFLKDAAIDQHLLARNRQLDLLEVIEKHPDLLGIGIDEGTAIVVSGNTFEVFGDSKVAIYDGKSADRMDEKFYFLSAGDKFDLQTRKAALKE